MPVDPNRFRHEYDLTALQRIRPLGRDFEMLVTPRYCNHFLTSTYEPFTADLIVTMSRRHDLFVDVGAHYGFFSLVAGRGNPDIEILALEPTPESFAVLTQNLELNGISAACARQVALSDRSGRGRFHVSLASDNCGFYPHPVAPPIGQIDVETVTVDELLAARAPCPLLMKMDTDGHELHVLNGMRETLARFRDLRLFVELNPKMQRLAGHDPEDLLSELERQGFEIYCLDESLRRPYRLRHAGDWPRLMTKPESYVNLYCCRRESSLSVAFFSHSAALGGAERSLLELVTELVADHGAMCTVVLPKDGPLQERLVKAGAGTLIAEYSHWRASAQQDNGATAERDFETWLVPSARALLGEPLKALRKIDPHVLTTHTISIPWGAFLAPILGKPHAWHLCEFGDVDFGFRFPVPLYRVVEIVRESSNVVFTAIDGIRDQLFPEDGNDLCKTLYRHVQIMENPGGPATEALFERPGAIHLGQFATLAPIKGQDLVVEAVARLVNRGWDLELVLAGSGSPAYRKELFRLISLHSLEDIVRVKGFIENVHDAMRRTDIVVIGSRSDGFGRTAVEAMLLGKPVVYPEVGGFAEYMRNGETGIGYPPGEVSPLAAAIETLLHESTLRSRLGRQAREYARSRFTKGNYGGIAVRELRRLRGSAPRIAPTWLDLLAHAATGANDEALLWKRRHDRLVESRAHANKRISAAELRARRSEEQVVRLKTRLGRATRELTEMYCSSTWRVALQLRKPIDVLAPPGSRQREAIRSLLDRWRRGKP